MSGLTGLFLPFSGLILHAHSDGAIAGDKHSWLMMHLIFWLLFVISAAWHIILNRRPLLSYIRSDAARSFPLSREARWAAVIMLALLLMMSIQQR